MNQSIGNLNLEMFISAAEDSESSRYKILAALKKYNESFRKNKIYPLLSELIELTRLLKGVLDEKQNLNKNFPRELIGFDLKNQKSIYQTKVYTSGEIEAIFNLIIWSLPIISETIEEGTAVFDYIDNNIKIEQIGIQPIYKEEGYLAIPDCQVGEIKIYRYESSIFSSQREKYRSLKVNFVYNIPNLLLVDTISQTIKTELKNKYSDLPNPAVFRVNTDLDFPFDQSIFPVVKRKFMKVLAA